MAKGKSIEELFRDSFGGEEVSPPGNIKDSIFDSLGAHEVESKYREAFADEEIAPSSAVWPRISRALWLAGFLSFRYNKLNIYYVAAGLLGATALFVGGEDAEPTKILDAEAIVLTVEAEIAEPIEEHGNLTVQSAQESPARKESQPKTFREKKETVVSDVVVDSNIARKNISAIDELDEFAVNGPDRVCAGGSAEFTLHPSNSAAKLYVEFANVQGSVVSFKKEGTYVAKYIDTVSGKLLAQKNVDVFTDEAPQIIGAEKICLSDQGSTFRVKDKKDLGVTYVWEFTYSKHVVLGNGYVRINPARSSVDTARLMKINENTGCVSYSVKTFTVLSVPDARFSVMKHGNLLVEFVDVSMSTAQSKWFVDGFPVEQEGEFVEFEEAGDYNVSHVAVDNFGCTDSVNKTITVEGYSLFVPDAFAPGSNVGTFQPIGNGLSEYLIEVFNGNNQKVWESSLLDDGKPAAAWDGTSGGQVLPAGAYYYKIKAQFVDGSVWKGLKKGDGYTTTGTIYLMDDL